MAVFSCGAAFPTMDEDRLRAWEGEAMDRDRVLHGLALACVAVVGAAAFAAFVYAVWFLVAWVLWETAA
jgi:hypothetical protein